ncbi:MAG: sigma 54-interacting transcriptional regulator [Polyangiaceae bacterium]
MNPEDTLAGVSCELAGARRVDPAELEKQWVLIRPVGTGATSVVWRARARGGGSDVAIKLAKDDVAAVRVVAEEARLLSRIERRWGPRLLDAGPGYFVTEWVEGARVLPLPETMDRERIAAILAHAVARSLEELHEADVRHGDIKLANVLWTGHEPDSDAAAGRVATLIDLGLATDGGAPARGATPRYAAPELLEVGEAGLASDLWALGLMLAELLDPRVADAERPADLVAAWDSPRSEPARWVQALMAPAPGGRPSAAWLAGRAAGWLGLSEDSLDAAAARVARVRRAYLAERSRDLGAGTVVPASVGEPARGWLQTAVDWQQRLSSPLGETTTLQPLGEVRTARWLVTLVGSSAAEWPLGALDLAEGELAARVVELASAMDPSAWTFEDLAGRGAPALAVWRAGPGDDRMPSLVRELARARPDPTAVTLAEDEAASGCAPQTLAVLVASALMRGGESGRAWAALARSEGAEVDAVRAEVARRRGDTPGAERALLRALAAPDARVSSRGRATKARLAWDRGDLESAEAALVGGVGAAVAEQRALIAWKRGALEEGVRILDVALSSAVDSEARGRLEAVRGILELSRGNAERALGAFGRAVELAVRSGAIVEEATYLTSEAAAASDCGAVDRALKSATRAALLWERLGRPAQAARAWLARAASLAVIGAVHATDEAAQEARARAIESRDAQAGAYALWARVEVRTPGDEQARSWVVQADQELRESSTEDHTRALARLLVWAPGAVDEERVRADDVRIGSLSAAVQWEWWGARARSGTAPDAHGGRCRALDALTALIDVPAPLSSRGPALDAAVRLATARGEGDIARRFEQARLIAARSLREATPAGLRSCLAGVAWARIPAAVVHDVAFAPAQVAELESIVRALSGRERLRPLLDQVLDTLVLWTGVERGLLLLRAPNGRLVPRAARNLGGRDLDGEHRILSQTIARRAMESGEAIVATDAFSALGDLHASVHALRLRSVVAVPLMARGDTLGVVYLDDRVRTGAFGPREVAWVRVVAAQAAMAIADARDAVLLRRAARRAERACARLAGTLDRREAELEVTRTQLDLARDSKETRYAYEEIVGRSEPMRSLLRLVDRVTPSDVPVLIVGESGTGKELVARAIHQNGPRSRRAFVSENCASVPESLLESTLFGHTRGAFTGANATRAGLFDVADGGTLFLDEIAEMSLGMQAKLLRVLQNGELRPVGSERTHKVDVRLIGATHRDLAALVASGAFREDLFYRIHVVTLRVPPLRERADDIAMLVDHFVVKHVRGAKPRVTRAAMAKLLAFAWPGNVRQLENEVRRALVLGDEQIDVEDLSTDVVRAGAGAGRGATTDLRSRVDALEAELVTDALATTRGNQTRAAQLLGLSRFGLQKMMTRLKMKAPV